ncbi:unnamed protein product [Effrenium voratum]|nr:unnamed protein product [Effrenium voratum]
MAVARALRAPLRQAWRSLASDRRLCSGPEKGVRPWSTLLEEVNGPAARGDVAGARDAFYRILAEQKPALKVQRNLANCVLKAYAIAADAEGAWAWAKTMHEMHLPLSAWSVGKLFGAAARSKSSATEEWLRQSQDLRLPLDGTATRTICAACAHATADQQRALSWLQRAQREVAMDERPEAQGASPEAENQVVSYTTLAKAAAKLGDLAQVHFWIQQIEAAGLAPDVVSFNIVIDAYAQQGRHHEASRWFGKMLEHGIPPNEVAFTTMITACARRGDAEEAEEWLLEMWRVVPWQRWRSGSVPLVQLVDWCARAEG